MKITTAAVKGKPRQVSTRYGERIVFDVAHADGLEETLWNPSGREWLLSLKAGDAVQLVLDEKGKSHVIEPQTTAVSLPPQSASPDRTDREQIERYIAGLGRLYGYCWHQAAEVLQGQAQSEESVRACASSLFIATTRKFAL